MDFPNSIELAHLPTPIEPLQRLSEELRGPEIFLKRDDLTGCALSGNKIRKLEFSVAEALDQGRDTLITCGAVQSNHSRATAIVAAKLGMKSLLVLRGVEEEVPDGNLFLDRLVGAEVRFITAEEYEVVDDIMANVAEELEKKGGKPYIIPEGASNEIGVWGYVKAAKEIKGQLEEMALTVDSIVIACGSGGTHTGLLLGKKLFGLESRIYGISAGDDKDYLAERISRIFNRTKERFKLDVSLGEGEIEIADDYTGLGYGISRPEETELIRHVALLEGIILDPVYTAKAMFGLRDLIRSGRFKAGERVLFIHTGGIFGLFPQRGLFKG